MELKLNWTFTTLNYICNVGKYFNHKMNSICSIVNKIKFENWIFLIFLRIL